MMNVDLGRFTLSLPRRQTRRRLITLSLSPASDVLSINGNTGIGGDTGFAALMESAHNVSCI